MPIIGPPSSSAVNGYGLTILLLSIISSNGAAIWSKTICGPSSLHNTQRSPISSMHRFQHCYKSLMHPARSILWGSSAQPVIFFRSIQLCQNDSIIYRGNKEMSQRTSQASRVGGYDSYVVFGRRIHGEKRCVFLMQQPVFCAKVRGKVFVISYAVAVKWHRRILSSFFGLPGQGLKKNPLYIREKLWACSWSCSSSAYVSSELSIQTHAYGSSFLPRRTFSEIGKKFHAYSLSNPSWSRLAQKYNYK
jgi:hypothetical protein